MCIPYIRFVKIIKLSNFFIFLKVKEILFQFYPGFLKNGQEILVQISNAQNRFVNQINF